LTIKDEGAGDAPGEPALGSKVSMAPEPEAMDIELEEPEPDDQPDWRIPYLQRLINGTLRSDPTKAR